MGIGERNIMIRTRFAPSPTGDLHLGGARTALYNWLHAKHHQGAFILRVEDTDEDRSSEEAMEQQLKALQWLGLDWDEGVQTDGLLDMGPYGPYRQSHRNDVYQQLANQLIDQGLAYYCFMTDAEQEALRGEEGRGRYQVHSPYRDQSLSESRERIAQGEKTTIRFKMPEESRDFLFKDLVRGDVRLSTDMVTDFVIIRSNGMPVYNFCCVCDDHMMGITHVFRGEEHLSNSLKQLVIYDALEWTPPQFGHLSTILGSDGKKLSKRTQAVSMDVYRDQGFLPEALINYLALLGWSHPEGEDVFDIETLIQTFSVDRIHVSAAQFDEQKLLWLNSEYIKRLSVSDLSNAIEPWCSEISWPKDSVWRENAVRLIQTELKTLADAPLCLHRLLGTAEVDSSCDEVLSWGHTREMLSWVDQSLGQYDETYLTEEAFKTLVKGCKSSFKVKGKQLFMPLRVMMILHAHGSELIELIKVVPVKQMRKNILIGIGVDGD